MHDSGKRIDMTLLVERLRTAGEYEAIGGATYLAEISRSVPTASHAAHYAEIVRDKAMLRALIESSTEILRDAYDESSEAREQVNRAEQSVFECSIARHGSPVLDATRIDCRGAGTHRSARKGRAQGRRRRDRLPGTRRHDRRLARFGELNILAARPSMGKTAFALNIAEYVSCHLRVPTLFVSLEMSAIELADRLLCAARPDQRPAAAHRAHHSRRPAEDHRIVQRDQPGAAVRRRQPSRTMTEIAAVGAAAEAKAQAWA